VSPLFVSYWRRKAVPVIGHGGPQGCEMLRLTHFLDNRLTDGGKVVSLTSQQPFTPVKILGTYFCYRLSRLEGSGAGGRIIPTYRESNPRSSILSLGHLQNVKSLLGGQLQWETLYHLRFTGLFIDTVPSALRHVRAACRDFGGHVCVAIHGLKWNCLHTVTRLRRAVRTGASLTARGKPPLNIRLNL
jgi:hypothetical protein